MEMGDSDLVFIDVDVDAANPLVKQEVDDTPKYSSGRRIPNEEQVLFLIHCMEKNPELARGRIRSAGAKARARRAWDQLRLRLNSVQDGVRKNTSQWMKYWTDKKTSVKKKAAEGEMELSPIEEKILYLCVGNCEPYRPKRNVVEFEISQNHSDYSEAPEMSNSPILASMMTRGQNNTTDTKTNTQTNSQTSFERILKVEERRLALEQTNAQLMRTILEQSAEKERTILSAVRSLSERVNERHEQEREMAAALRVLGEGAKRGKRVRPARELRFKCSTCSYATYHRALFREHRNRHYGIKPYKCSLCPYASVSKKYVKQHESRHTLCECGRVARATCGRIASHVARACERCRREQVDEKALAPHTVSAVPRLAALAPSSRSKRSQRVNKPHRFECGVCGWSSRSARAAQLHLLHHPPTPPGPTHTLPHTAHTYIDYTLS